MLGTWNLQVETPFGKHPGTLKLERAADNSVNGFISSRLGHAALSDIMLTAESFEANVSLELQGRTYNARVSARAEGNTLNGTIKVNIPFAPSARFTGTRA